MSTGSEHPGPVRGAPGSPPPDSGTAGWRPAARELVVAALLILALAGAAWILDGVAAAGLVVLVCVALSLAGLRALIEPTGQPPSQEGSHEPGPSRSFLGFWRMRSDLHDATASLGAFDHALRPRLVNLLAARLSERHGISLAEEPDAARALFEAGLRRRDLWPWIDPRRPTAQDAASRPGIPPAVLAALIDRLEKL